MIMNTALYRAEVLYLVNRLLPNPEGAIIMETNECKMGLGKDEVIIFSPEGKTVLKWEDLSDEMLYAIYCFIDVSLKMPPKVADSFIELGLADEKTWYLDPVEVLDKLAEPIGRIGIAVDEVNEHGTQLSVISISPEGSWSTLTMYTKENTEGSKELAKSDLVQIAESIIQISEKL